MSEERTKQGKKEGRKKIRNEGKKPRKEKNQNR